MGLQKRADYVYNDPTSNKAFTYFNVCPKLPSNGPAPPLPAGPVRALEWPFPRQPAFFAIGVSSTQDFV